MSDDRSFLGPLVAGGGAGMAASLIRVPTEVVKQRMQSGVWHLQLHSLFQKPNLSFLGSFPHHALPICRSYVECES